MKNDGLDEHMTKDMFKETKDLLVRHGYRVCFVPHKTIEDYNATYNVVFDDRVITTGASEELGIPLNEIWVSELLKPYEKYSFP